MSDIKCVVCGEPWDSYLSDSMDYWEVKLFKIGAGCPACCGVEPEGGWEVESFEDIENGDEDPYERIVAYMNRDKRPKWEEPADEAIWSCASCGSELMRDHITGKKYAICKGKTSEDDMLKNPHFLDGNKKVCAHCR